MSEKFALMHAEKATYKIGFMAGLLGVSRAGYYAWARRGPAPSPRAARRQALAEQIAQIHEASNQTSGFRRVLAELRRCGVAASEGLVRALMRDLGIFGVQPRSRKRTTIPAEDEITRPDLLRRDFTADAPGQRLVGDITYLRTSEGWLYLATVIDLFNREVVGWSMAAHMRAELVCDALRMAHTHDRLTQGAVFHSDRGSVYTPAEYAALATSSGVRLSVGRTGCAGTTPLPSRSSACSRTRCTTVTRSPPAHEHGSTSCSTSRCSTTGSGCTRPSGTAPPPKSAPTTTIRPRSQPDHQRDRPRNLTQPTSHQYRTCRWAGDASPVRTESTGPTLITAPTPPKHFNRSVAAASSRSRPRHRQVPGPLAVMSSRWRRRRGEDFAVSSTALSGIEATTESGPRCCTKPWGLHRASSNQARGCLIMER